MMIWKSFSTLTVLFSCISGYGFSNGAGVLHPIVLIPGDGGSQVEAKINKSESVHYVCSKVSDWFPLWLNIEQMIPEFIDCWADNMKMRYNNVTRKTRNNDGVETRIPGFGNTSTVEYLDTSQRSFSVYFANVVKFLLPLGYERGINIHGAPYDFRKAANELGDFFEAFKKLIETTFVANKGTKVILIGHSMGCPTTLYFLNRRTQAWKDKYIESFITLAGVWGGTVRAVKVFAVGDNLGNWFINKNSLMVEQRTSPSLAWLMPSNEFWTEDHILVQTEKKNFSISNFKEFFYELDQRYGYDMYLDTKDLNKGLDAPGVETFCIHGGGVDTTKKLVYPPGTWPDGNPVLNTGDGDGTVNMRSLLGCLKWSSKQTQKVHHKVFNKTNHLELLRLDPPAKYVSDLVHNINQQTLIENTPTVELLV